MKNETKNKLPDFSYFRAPITSITPADNINMQEVIKRVLSPLYVQATQKIQHEESKTERDKLKCELLNTIRNTRYRF
jgi:hypothetical protein